MSAKYKINIVDIGLPVTGLSCILKGFGECQAKIYRYWEAGIGHCNQLTKRLCDLYLAMHIVLRINFLDKFSIAITVSQDQMMFLPAGICYQHHYSALICHPYSVFVQCDGSDTDSASSKISNEKSGRSIRSFS